MAGLIGSIGVSSGLAIGLLLCLWQQNRPFLYLDPLQEVPYPIEMQWFDFVLAAVVLFGLTLASAYRPATKAAKS